MIFEEINTLPNYVHINISSSIACYFTCLLNWNDNSIEFPCTNKASKFSWYFKIRLRTLKSDGEKWKDTTNHFTPSTLFSPLRCCKYRYNIYIKRLWLYMKISVLDTGKHILCTSNCSRVLTHSTNALNSNIPSYDTYDCLCNPRTDESRYGLSVI